MSPDDRAIAATPTAVALIAAVADRDQAAVADLLARTDDWAALAVVLADRASSATGYSITSRVLADLAAGATHQTTADRYGLPVTTVTNLAQQNNVLESDDTLTYGRWVPVRGVLRWVSDEPDARVAPTQVEEAA